MATPHWIEPHRTGLYVRPADLWIDPARPVAHALITHGHADHARAGHGETIATPHTLAIMGVRYGVGLERGGGTTRPMPYGETMERNGVRICFHPAGHVLGSAQILLERGGERVVVSGDYKTVADPTCAPFTPVPCDIFITEATFGLPVYRHPPIAGEIAKLLAARAAAPERCVLVGAYALGKAQRVIAELRAAGYHDPIYLHGALEKLCRLYEELGVPLGLLRPVAGAAPDCLQGAIVLCPPAALTDRWSQRLPDPITAMASGWMRLRQRARQRQVELPLVISDHADWDELTGTLATLRPRETWVTHGSAAALVHWCATRQLPARALHLPGHEEEG